MLSPVPMRQPSIRGGWYWIFFRPCRMTCGDQQVPVLIPGERLGLALAAPVGVQPV